jgi:hypothetical protein
LQCYGVDLSFNFFLSAMGIPINPPRHAEPIASRLFHLVNAHKTGTFTKVRSDSGITVPQEVLIEY